MSKTEQKDEKKVVQGEVLQPPPAEVVNKVKALSKQWNLSEAHVWEMMEKQFIMGSKGTDYKVNASTSSQFIGHPNNQQPNNQDSSLTFMREFLPMFRDMAGGKDNGGQQFDMNKIFMFGMMKSMFSPPPAPVQSGMSPEILLAISGNKGDDTVMKMIMEDRKSQQQEALESRRENTLMMNTMMQGLLGKGRTEMEELIKSQGAEHKMDLEKMKMEFVTRMGAGGDPSSIDNIAMSAYREQITTRIKDMVTRGFIPEKDILNEKGEINWSSAFDKVIGMGREFIGMANEFAKNQPATAPPQRVPVAMPSTGPVPAPAPGPPGTTAPPVDNPPPKIEIPVTPSPIQEHNGMEIIGVKIKATTPR